MGTDDSNKTYLGDSVYAEYENGAIALTATYQNTTDEHGWHTEENTILLSPEVLRALITFVSQFRLYAPTPPLTP